jgi:hypothetical protein
VLQQKHRYKKGDRRKRKREIEREEKKRRNE